ncbi:MAG TPA: hypothetical protein VMV79_02535 [Alphaproteobacteria bacterium]|nr:hypothetical protein [Alphaproteobacteria bacterium]
MLVIFFLSACALRATARQRSSASRMNVGNKKGGLLAHPQDHPERGHNLAGLPPKSRTIALAGRFAMHKEFGRPRIFPERTAALFEKSSHAESIFAVIVYIGNKNFISYSVFNHIVKNLTTYNL